MSGRLEIRFERQSYKPSEHIAGTVGVLESLKARELTIALEYREITPDYRVVGRAVPAGAPLHVGDVEQGASFGFTFELPADALPNQDGQVGATSWGLHARLDRLGPDLHAWQPLNVP